MKKILLFYSVGSALCFMIWQLLPTPQHLPRLKRERRDNSETLAKVISEGSWQSADGKSWESWISFLISWIALCLDFSFGIWRLCYFHCKELWNVSDGKLYKMTSYYSCSSVRLGGVQCSHRGGCVTDLRQPPDTLPEEKKKQFLITTSRSNCRK